VTSQQLLSIIVIAMVANAVLIAIALITMRRSSARSRPGKERDLAPASGSVPAEAAIDAITLGQAAATMATGSELPVGGPMEPSSDGPPRDGVGDETGDESGDEALMLLETVTGLESPHAWRRALDDELVRMARYHRPATVMLVELDGFDRLADRLGEAAGARIVVATARTLRAEARAADRCARLGRGRFAILLPETDEVRAINFVERVRAECDRWLEAGEITLRLAIGWAILEPSAGATTALQEAERRLDSERRHRAGAGA
jgi:diguanylate cyclase (GGDEF)-like protein